MRRFVSAALVCVLTLAVILTAAGCGEKGEGAGDKTVVTVVVADGFGDRSFYDSAKEGLDRLSRDCAVEPKTIECQGENFEQQIRNAADQSQIVVPVGYQFDMVAQVAKDYPDVKFIWCDNESAEKPENLLCITYAQNEGDFLAGALAALLFSFLTITLRANQNVTGLALTIFGTGVGQYIGEFMRVREGTYVAVSNTLKGAFNGSPFPAFLQELPVVGRLLFSHSIFTYLGIALAVAMGLYLHRSRSGLYLRAVGESPATADAAGISVTRYKYLATVIGGGISAIGGMVYIMTVVGGVWNHEGLSGVGWLAVALVIFCLWSPYRAIWGSILFGGLLILYLRMPIDLIPDQIYKILPYVVTVIVLVFTSMRNNRDKQPPASLGLAYFREER